MKKKIGHKSSFRASVPVACHFKGIDYFSAISDDVK
jgi:hypothetical protein